MPEFEWDERKNRLNIAKHGVSFEQGSLIFDAPRLTRPDRRFAYGEIRLIGIGTIGGRVFLTVVYTERLGKTRLISARPASRRERRDYEQALLEGPDAGGTGRPAG